MEATFSCPQCSFCVDHDIMLRVLKHFFNCTSFQYIMDLSCGHHPGLGHTHFPGTLKYKHVSDSPVSNKNATPQACTSQREPAAEENMSENEFHDSSTMIPPVEIKTEPAEDTMDGPDCTVVEPTAPPAQMMDTAGFGEDCHPVSVVCAMGGMQDAVAGSSNDTDGLLQHDTETHTITTEPVGAPSMVVTRSPAMAATRATSAGSHGNNDGGTLELDRLLDTEQPPQDMLQQTFKAVQLMAKRQRELEARQTQFIATVTQMLETTAAGCTNASSSTNTTTSSSIVSNPVPPPAKRARQSFDWLKPNSPKLCEELSDDKLHQIYLHSNGPAHFATRCAKIMFSGPELVSRNVQGRGKTALNPVKIDRIREYVEKVYSKEEDKETMWTNCRRRIDAWGRHLKAMGVPREDEFTTTEP